MAFAPSDSHKMTADEFFALPEELPHAQLINGELVVNSPAFVHQRIIVEVIGLFRLHAETHPGCGVLGIELDTPLDAHNVFKPDLWWVPDERRPADWENRFTNPPSLVIEVRSPLTWRYDVGTKLRMYEAHGVAEVWLVDTAADVVLVYRRRAPESIHFDVELEFGPGDTLFTPLVEGWEIDLARLFAP